MGRFDLYSRRNAVFAWVCVGLLLVLAANFVLSNEPLWGAVAVVVALAGLVPAVAVHDWRAMPPWGLPALTLLPFLLRGYPVYAKSAVYLGVAAVVLMIAIYLTAFTSVEMTAQFGILFVVTTTLAVGTVWAGARGLADLYLGGSYLGGLGALERDLLLSTIGGVLASIVFEGYFRERASGELHGTSLEDT